VLDLDNVEFMDSSGLSAVVRARRSADRNGHHLTILYKSPEVHQLFKLTNLLRSPRFNSSAKARLDEEQLPLDLEIVGP
jgi:anti-anti-sigma factor